MLNKTLILDYVDTSKLKFFVIIDDVCNCTPKVLLNFTDTFILELPIYTLKFY